MRVWRVLPVDPKARRAHPYHPLYVPPGSEQNRCGNPGKYRELYVSDSAAGAIAESFGPFATWSNRLLDHPRGHTRRLVSYELDADVCNLDDAEALLRRALRPSEVVTRDRKTTRAWALAIFAEDRWAGVGWWSYYDPRWQSAAVWDVTKLKVDAVEMFDMTHPAAEAARAVLLRPLAT